MDAAAAAALQQQLADLMAVVNEERGLRQQAEAVRQEAENACQAAEAARQQAENVQPPPDAQAPAINPVAQQPVRAPKIGVLDKYNGSRGVKAEFYASQVSLYILANVAAFPDDRSRIIFALSYLTGQATSTYAEFTAAFESMFYDTEKQTKAKRSLRNLKQTKTVGQ
ncbi:hypothetical protein PTTG_29788 [Puccinia triticina 1-1 BBBD Race 1]|uniref:DUF4939 domain-containing protein n=1 Tax=Puccinia triticina (isolate 1-1 / race 1 (BBBD)) TaxID=630390 RepID=A0A180G200_PUCT1|nr:hypothetical protein PTTG_29788 [Puccinia triticina 1-1 BBBD Race 1]